MLSVTRVARVGLFLFIRHRSRCDPLQCEVSLAPSLWQLVHRKTLRRANAVQGFRSPYRPRREGAVRFGELLERVAAVDREMRIRFTSPHPKDFSDDVLAVRARQNAGARKYQLTAWGVADCSMHRRVPLQGIAVPRAQCLTQSAGAQHLSVAP